MKQNVGKADKTVRIVAGLAIAGAGIYFQNWLGLIAIVPLGTAMMGSCPLYTVFGVGTCPMEQEQK